MLLELSVIDQHWSPTLRMEHDAAFGIHAFWNAPEAAHGKMAEVWRIPVVTGGFGMHVRERRPRQIAPGQRDGPARMPQSAPVQVGYECFGRKPQGGGKD